MRISGIVLEPFEKRCSWGEAKRFVALCFAVDSMKRFVVAHPQNALMVLVNRPNKRFIPAGGIAKIVAISLEWQGPGRKTCKSETAQTSPNDSLLICEHLADTVLGQALRISKA